jgi:hypothetical protein
LAAEVINEILEEIGLLGPAVEKTKLGTPHGGHDGWGMSGDGPGRVQCRCGESLDEIIGLPPVKTWYIAHCVECEMPMPFRGPKERDRWADGHAATGHQVARYTSLR